MIERSINSMTHRIMEHQSWINDPYLKVPKDIDERQVKALVSKKWPSDILRLEELIVVLSGILENEHEQTIRK